MIIKVKVKPNAGENRFEKVGENEYLAYVNEAPVKGKANVLLIKMIARHFGVSVDKVKLKTFSGRNKIVDFGINFLCNSRIEMNLNNGLECVVWK